MLVEKPGGLGTAQIDELLAAAERGRATRQGRLQPPLPSGGLRDLAAEVHSGAHGELMHLRGRYGHGGRLGYDREWRAAARAVGRR